MSPCVWLYIGAAFASAGAATAVLGWWFVSLSACTCAAVCARNYRAEKRGAR